MTYHIGTVGTAGTARAPDMPGSAREAVHKAFRTTVSRGGVAPFCYALRPPCLCGELCNLLTAAIESDRATMAGELERAAVILTEFADGKAGHLGYSDADTCTCSRCRAKRWLTEYDRRRR